jgi:hypothetical protein
MLRELQTIVENHTKIGFESELQDAAAALRAHQFIWKDKRGHSRHYDLLVHHQKYFENLFGAFGDSFFVDHHFGYCGILPRANTPALKLKETLFLLILAKMHDHECRKACTENGRSSPSESLLIDEYEALTGKPKPSKAETRDALERLAKCGVIELGAVNSETEIRMITILPSIMKVVNKNFLEELLVYVKTDSTEEEMNSGAADNMNESESDNE